MLLPLEHDHGQTDSRALAQRLSDPDWIHILGKQRQTCVKGKVTVYVTCQSSENRCFWRVIDHKYQALCCVAWCTIYSAVYKRFMYPIQFSPGSV